MTKRMVCFMVLAGLTANPITSFAVTDTSAQNIDPLVSAGGNFMNGYTPPPVAGPTTVDNPLYGQQIVQCNGFNYACDSVTMGQTASSLSPFGLNGVDGNNFNSDNVNSIGSRDCNPNFSDTQAIAAQCKLFSEKTLDLAVNYDALYGNSFWNAAFGRWYSNPGKAYIADATHNLAYQTQYNDAKKTGGSSGLLALIALGGAGAIYKATQDISVSQNTAITGKVASQDAFLKGYTQTKKSVANAEAVNHYLAQTDSSSSQNPAACAQAAMGKAMQESTMTEGGRAQSIAAGISSYNPPLVYDGEGGGPFTENDQVALNAGLSGDELSADSLFSPDSSNGSNAYGHLILDPYAPPSVPTMSEGAQAMVRYHAAIKERNARMSLARHMIGTVGAMNAPAQTEAGQQAIEQANSSQPVPPSTPIGKGTADTNPVTPVSQDTETAGGVSPLAKSMFGPYLGTAQRLAAETNVPVNFVAAIAKEEGGRKLSSPSDFDVLYGGKTMAQASAYLYNKTRPSVAIPIPEEMQKAKPKIGTRWSAKGPFQMIDSTIVANDSSIQNLTQVLTDPSVSMEVAFKGFSGVFSACHGSVPCAFAAWNGGAGVAGVRRYASACVKTSSGYSCPDWKSFDFGLNQAGHSLNSYVAKGMSFYSGDVALNPSKFNAGGTSGAGDTSGPNGASNSAMSIADSMINGTIGNKDWYAFLESTTEAGAWKTIAYLQAMRMNVAQQRYKLMSQIVAATAVTNSIALSNSKGTSFADKANASRANAIMQSQFK